MLGANHSTLLLRPTSINTSISLVGTWPAAQVTRAYDWALVQAYVQAYGPYNDLDQLIRKKQRLGHGLKIQGAGVLARLARVRALKGLLLPATNPHPSSPHLSY